MGYPAQQQYPPQAPQGQWGGEGIHGQAQAPAAPTFLTPTAGGNAGPLPRHLIGRTVICLPRSYDPNAQFQGQSRPSMTLDVIVLDGGPIEYGDNRDRDASKQTPNTHRCATPARFNGVMWNSGIILDKVRIGLSQFAGQPSQPTVGVIEQGTQGNRPYMIVDPAKHLDGSDRPDGAQRMALAQHVYTMIEQGQFVNPVPEVIWTAPNQAAPAAPQFQPPQYPNMAQAGYGAPWPQSAPPQSAPPAQYQPQYPSVQPGPQGAPAGAPVPANWDPRVWATLTPEQQAQVLGQPVPMAGPGI